jgi:hypothetical protein
MRDSNPIYSGQVMTIKINYIQMKNLFLLFYISAIIIAFTSCGSDKKGSNSDEVESVEKEIETAETAIEYNDYILDIQRMVDNAMADFIDESDTYSKEVAETKVEEIGNIIDEAIYSVEAKRDFDGKDDFKNAMLRMLEAYKDLLYNEFYVLFVDYAGDEILTDEQLDDLDLTYAQFMEKYERAHTDFNDFQQTFADKWNFTIN